MYNIQLCACTEVANLNYKLLQLTLGLFCEIANFII